MNSLSRTLALQVVALLLAPLLSRAQGSLSVYGIDVSRFPTVAGNILPLDDGGNPITGLGPDDIIVTENGVRRPVTLVHCDDDIVPPDPLSVAVGIDASSSMEIPLLPSLETPFLATKGGVRYLANLLRFPLDEMAVQNFSGYLMGLLPFTRSSPAVGDFVVHLPLGSDNNFASQFLAPGVGLMNIVKQANGRRIAVLLTDGDFSGSLAPSVATMEAVRDSCLKYGIRLYVIAFDNQSVQGPPPFLPLVEETGGKVYLGIKSGDEARAAIRAIVDTAIPPKSACRLEWESVPGCPADRHVVITVPGRGLSTSIDYRAPDAFVPDLVADPPALSFGDVSPGSSAAMRITLTARTLPVSIASLTMSDPRFTILDGGAPPAFTLNAGESRTLTVGFTPTDSTPAFGELVIGAELCADPVRMVGGGGPVADPLKVVAPNGGEVYTVGDDELIRWEGVPFDEKVRIEYSTDAGGSWSEIAAAASGLGHRWTIPPTPSHYCLVRVSRTGPPPGAFPDVTFPDPSHGITACAFAPAGDLVATGGIDSTLRIWSAATGALVRAIPLPQGTITSIEFSPDGRYIATGSSFSGMNIWDLSTGALVTTLVSYRGSMASVAFSPDGGRILLEEEDGWTTLWSLPSGRRLWMLHHQSPALSSRFSHDGNRIIMVGGFRAVLLDAITGKIVDPPLSAGTSNRVIYAEYDRTDARILLATEANTVVVVDAQDGHQLLKLSLPPGTTSFIAHFSPTGKSILTISRDASLWDITTGALIRTFPGYGEPLLCGAFSPNGDRVLTGGARGTGRVRSVADGVIPEGDLSDSLWWIVLPATVAADFELPADTICEGSCIEPVNLTTGRALSWRWNLIGASPATSTAASPGSVCYERAGVYPIELIATGALGADTLFRSITVLPRPAIPTVIRCGDLLSSSPGAHYQWRRDGVPIPGAEGRELQASVAGDYTVTVTNEQGCSATSAPIPGGVGGRAEATVTLPEVEALPGEVIDLPIVITFTDPPPGAAHATIRLRLRRSLMTPLDTSARQHIEGDDRIVELGADLPPGESVTVHARFMATLGDTVGTRIAVEGLVIDGLCEMTVAGIDGEMRLAGLCTDGGSRLVAASGAAALKPIHPNPLDGPVTIEYTLAENGHTRLILVDMLGREIVTIVDADEGPGEHAVLFTRSGLPAGHYLCVLHTPTRMFTRELVLP